MGKFILHVSGGSYTFTFHASSGNKVAVSPPFIIKSSAQEAINETRMVGGSTHLYKKQEREGQFYFELYSEARQLLLVSEQYRSKESRDETMALLKSEVKNADYFEAI